MDAVEESAGDVARFEQLTADLDLRVHGVSLLFSAARAGQVWFSMFSDHV